MGAADITDAVGLSVSLLGQCDPEDLSAKAVGNKVIVLAASREFRVHFNVKWRPVAAEEPNRVKPDCGPVIDGSSVVGEHVRDVLWIPSRHLRQACDEPAVAQISLIHVE